MKSIEERLEVKSIEERLEEIQDDPVKLKRSFNFIWIVSYGMLMLGAFIIIAVLIQDRL